MSLVIGSGYCIGSLSLMEANTSIHKVVKGVIMSLMNIFWSWIDPLVFLLDALGLLEDQLYLRDHERST